MIAAAGAGMPSVEHEFLGSQPRLAGFFVDAVVLSTSSSQFLAG